MFTKRFATKKKEIRFNGDEISYTLKTSRRAKNVRLAVYCDGSLVATRPYWLAEKTVEKFIYKKIGWIISKISHFKKFKIKTSEEAANEYLEHKEAARKLAETRIYFFNQIYNFKFNRINIRKQKTRWGSCSRKGNLNFNYKIALLEERVADYIIVHELCHLREFNHSERFWDLVLKTMPDYKILRKKLKSAGN